MNNLNSARRNFLLAGGGLSIANALRSQTAPQPLTVGTLIDRIKANIGIPCMKEQSTTSLPERRICLSRASPPP